MQAAVKLAPWERIPWSTVKSVVLHLQSMIYRAAAANDTPRVHAFQSRLLRNAHARLLAVRRVTDSNRADSSLGVNSLITSEARIALARTLRITDKGLPFCVTRRRRLGRCLQDVVRDRAKQMLVRLALEPEWEARFEDSSFGYRPRRSYRDAMDAITFSLKGKEKFVLVANSCYIFQEMEHRAVMSKLRNTLPIIAAQVEAWLNGGIMALRWINPGLPRAGDFGVITPLLANIALHGLESALYQWHAKFYPGHPAPLIVRYCEQFVVLNRSHGFILDSAGFIRDWLRGVGIKLDPDRYTISDSRTGFEFIGFKFQHAMKNEDMQIRVRLSKNSCKLFLSELKTVIYQSRGGTCYNLINRMAPKLVRWARYFRYCYCRRVYRKLDQMIYQKLRPWVFRRRRSMGRAKAKLKFFPENQTYRFEGTERRSSWVLTDGGTERRRPVFLPLLRWFSGNAKPVKSLDDILINLDQVVLPDPSRRRRLVQLDTLLELWSTQNLLNLDDEELEDFAHVMKLGNKQLWKAVTDQDDGEFVYLYDNPVFVRIKEDISRKLSFMFAEAEESNTSNLLLTSTTTIPQTTMRTKATTSTLLASTPRATDCFHSLPRISP